MKKLTELNCNFKQKNTTKKNTTHKPVQSFKRWSKNYWGATSPKMHVQFLFFISYFLASVALNSKPCKSSERFIFCVWLPQSSKHRSLGPQLQTKHHVTTIKKTQRLQKKNKWDKNCNVKHKAMGVTGFVMKITFQNPFITSQKRPLAWRSVKTEFKYLHTYLVYQYYRTSVVCWRLPIRCPLFPNYKSLHSTTEYCSVLQTTAR